MQYFFATDILGETTDHVPRHSRVYDDFASAMVQPQDRRIKAFAAFRQDVASAAFPGGNETVALNDAENEVLTAFLADPRDGG